MMRLAILLVMSALLAVAADEIVFNGIPEVRIDSDGYYTKKAEFSPDARCTIVRRGKSFVWTSRGNRKLNRIDAGDFTYYISPEGSGYVKIRNKAPGTPGWDYMEQLSTELVTVTYWGHVSGAQSRSRR